MAPKLKSDKVTRADNTAPEEHTQGCVSVRQLQNQFK
jgi:hypothetical protein